MTNLAFLPGISQAFEYCPRCGGRGATKGSNPFRCTVCPFTFFFGPTAAVGAIVVDQQNRVLVTRRANDPGRGKLGMPGGFIDQNESAEEALRREVREEIGALVVRTEFLITVPNQYLYQGYIIPVLDLYYQCQVEGLEQMHFGDGEVEDCFFAAIDEEMLSNLAFTANRSALRYFRDTVRAK